MAEETKPKPPFANKKPQIVGLKAENDGDPIFVSYQGKNYDLTRLTDEETEFLLKQGPAFPYLKA